MTFFIMPEKMFETVCIKCGCWQVDKTVITIFMNYLGKIIFAVFLFVIIAGCNAVKKVTSSPCVVYANSTTQRIVESTACSLNQMRTELDGPIINDLLDQSKGVFIFPDVYKAAFMVGAEGGAGVLCVKDETGFWNGPAFFSMVGVDIGLQGGIAGKTVMVFLMDDQAVADAFDGKIDFSLGADIAYGRVGDSTHRGSYDVEGNVFALTYQAGVFGGMAYRTGAIMASRNMNKEYYGQNVAVKDLLLTHKYDKPEADILLLNLIGL